MSVHLPSAANHLYKWYDKCQTGTYVASANSDSRKYSGSDFHIVMFTWLVRPHVEHELNTFFISHIRVHARLMRLNLPYKALVYTLNMCMTVCRYTCACQECTRQLWIMRACKFLAKDSGINSINMFIYSGVIPLIVQDVNPSKELLTVKLKWVEGVPFPIIISNSRQCDKFMSIQ